MLSYARDHHLSLSPRDRRHVDEQLARLTIGGTTTAALLATHVISRQFLRTLLETEIIVRKVELAVTRGHADSGPAYHLEVFAIPTTSGGSSSAAYQEAVTLATDGAPVPADAEVRTEWAAPFRLGSHVRAAVLVAQPGDYLGPFAQGNHLLVVRFLNTANHHYGRPARLVLQTRLFRAWLARELQRAHPECFRPNGESAVCPPAVD